MTSQCWLSYVCFTILFSPYLCNMAFDLHRMQMIKSWDHYEYCFCSNRFPHGRQKLASFLWFLFSLRGWFMVVNAVYVNYIACGLFKPWKCLNWIIPKWNDALIWLTVECILLLKNNREKQSILQVYLPIDDKNGDLRLLVF